MPAKPKSDGPLPEPIRTYGCTYPVESVIAKGLRNPQFFYDQYAFARRLPVDLGCPPRTELFKRIISSLNPSWFEWHEWTESAVDACCNNQWIAFAGCSGSAKTHNIAGFACAWWLCDPGASSVIFCSTTAKALRKRGWAEVQKFYTTIPSEISGPGRFGNFVDSRMMWQNKKGDDKHAIMGIAVEEGETMKVSDNIKGVHTRRQMVIVDEATAVPPAIFEACTNLYSYPDEFILVMMGNPRSRLDEFGKFCEPLNGWNSVDVDTETWETIAQINGVNGIVIRYDAEKSPNIVNPLPNGKLVSKHLPTKEKVALRRNKAGSENDPSYWSNDRGFWAPEGLRKTVFSEVSLVQYECYKRHEFTGENFQIIAAFDPARTGDRPTLRFGALGEIAGGELGLEWMPPIVIKVNAHAKKTIAYQLLDGVRAAFENIKYRGAPVHCRPSNLGIDTSGAGAEVCDIFQQHWSRDIMRVDFGGSPSNSPCSHEDPSPANEVYRNKRAEMYFRTRNIARAGQLKGVDQETGRELCNIEYDDSKAFITFLSKEEYRAKYQSSPDYADSGVILVEVARRRGMRVAPVGESRDADTEHEVAVQKSQELYMDITYQSEEMPGKDEEPYEEPKFEIVHL